MNKNIFYVLALAGLTAFGSSCADPDLAPIITFDQAGKGAYVRLVEKTDALINLLDIPGSTFTYSVEFVDLERGALVSEYRLDVVYQDKNAENGDNSTGPQQLRSFSAGEFLDTPRGYKGLNDITLTADEVIRAAGIDATTILAGDNFLVKGTLTLQDGSTFTFDNSSNAVNGSAFQGFFDFSMPAGCPSDLAATHDYSSSDMFCAGTVDGQVTIEPLGAGVYVFDDWSFGAYVFCYNFDNTGNWGGIQFQDVCKVVEIPAAVDAFGDTWTFEQSFAGEEWTIKWVNTYGEFGTAIVKQPGGWDLTAR